MTLKIDRKAFTILEIVLAVIILAIGVIPVLNLFLSSSRTVEKGGLILEATIAAQDILDRAKTSTFLWANIPLKINIPDDNFREFKLPESFAKKYQASGTLEISIAPGHTILGTGANETNLIQISVTIFWIENHKLRTSKLETYKANINSFLLKSSTRL